MFLRGLADRQSRMVEKRTSLPHGSQVRAAAELPRAFSALRYIFEELNLFVNLLHASLRHIQNVEIVQTAHLMHPNLNIHSYDP